MTTPPNLRHDAPLPEVTVLVLAYNHEPYIAECLDGILTQDFAGRIEVLVGEDRSTDGTAAIVQGYAARHPDVIRVIRSESNVGMRENNRRLIRAARGRYIAYCEGDDVWHRSDKLRLQVDALEHRDDVAGVHSDVEHLMYVNGQARVHRDHWAWARPGSPELVTFGDLLARNPVQTCSVVLRASALKDYPESHWARAGYPMEDWPMFLHAVESGPLLRLPQRLATYRHAPGSATRSDPARMASFLRGERRLIDDAGSARPELARERLEGLARVHRSLVRLGVQSGDPEVVREAQVAAEQDGVPQSMRLTLIARAMDTPWSAQILTRAVRRYHAVRSAAHSHISTILGGR